MGIVVAVGAGVGAGREPGHIFRGSRRRQLGLGAGGGRGERTGALAAATVADHPAGGGGGGGDGGAGAGAAPSAVEAALFWADALGVGAFAVAGAIAADAGGVGGGLMAVLCGVLTAVGGGVGRDVLTGRKARVLFSEGEVYAVCAAGGAVAYLAAMAAGGGGGGTGGERDWATAASEAVGVAVAVAGRWVAWTWGIRLPVWSEELRGRGRRRDGGAWGDEGDAGEKVYLLGGYC